MTENARKSHLYVGLVPLSCRFREIWNGIIDKNYDTSREERKEAIQ